MAKIDITLLQTCSEYSAAHTTDEKPLSPTRVGQLAKEGRIRSVMIGEKLFIYKNSRIAPSKKKPGRRWPAKK